MQLNFKMETENRNDLLKRLEVAFYIESNGNPGLEVGKKAILEKFKTDEDKIVVRAVRSQFGSNKFLIEAYIYDSAEAKEMFEPRVKEKKKAGGK